MFFSVADLGHVLALGRFDQSKYYEPYGVIFFTRKLRVAAQAFITYFTLVVIKHQKAKHHLGAFVFLDFPYFHYQV